MAISERPCARSDHSSLIIQSKFFSPESYKAGAQSKSLAFTFVNLFASTYYCALIRCLARLDKSDSKDVPRFRELTHMLKDTYAHDQDILWEAFGIAPEIEVTCYIIFYGSSALITFLVPTYMSSFRRTCCTK
jgi:hypothetical protein